jgi:hypothetical protein
MIETWYKHEVYRRSNPFLIQFEQNFDWQRRPNQKAIVCEFPRFEDEIGPDHISTRLGYQHGSYTLGYFFDGPVSSVSIICNTGTAVIYTSKLLKIDVDVFIPDEKLTFKKMCLYTTKFPLGCLDYCVSYDTLKFKNIRVFPKIYKVIVVFDSLDCERKKHGDEACVSADQFYSKLLKKGLLKQLSVEKQ